MVSDLLSEIKTALENDDKQRVVELSPGLQDAFARRRSRENAHDELANRIRLQNSDRNLTSASTEYLNAVTAADQARIAVDVAMIEYIGDESEADDIIEIVESAIEVEASLNDSIEKFTSQIDESDVSLPAILVLTGPDRITFPENLYRHYEYTVTNVGGESATGIKLELEADLDLDIHPNEIESISANEEVTVELSGSSVNTGVHELKLSATSDADSDAISISAGVASKKNYLESALQDVDELRRTLAETRKSDESEEDTNDGSDNANQSRNNNESQSREGLRGLERQLEQVTKKIEESIYRIEQNRRERQINNKIEASINQLEAFMNQVDKSNKNRIDSGDASLLLHNASEILPRLKTAKEISVN